MTNEKPKTANAENEIPPGTFDPEKTAIRGPDQHSKPDKHAGKGQSPKQQRETARENQSEKGSGEGMTGMQRGAGHPTGR